MTGDTAFYVWGALVMGVVLFAAELLSLALRLRNIRMHLGYKHRPRRNRLRVAGERVGACEPPRGAHCGKIFFYASEASLPKTEPDDRDRIDL